MAFAAASGQENPIRTVALEQSLASSGLFMSNHHLAALVFVGLGLLSALFPRVIFFFEEGWKFRDAEPSDTFLLVTRIIGVITVIAGLMVAAAAPDTDSGSEARTRSAGSQHERR